MLIPTRRVLNILKKNGFIILVKKKKHWKLVKFKPTISIVIVPIFEKKIPKGVMDSIIIKSGIKREYFEKKNFSLKKILKYLLKSK